MVHLSIPAVRPSSAESNTHQPRSLPEQRWRVAEISPEAEAIAAATALPPLLAQVLVNRGFSTTEAAERFLDPTLEALPAAVDEFPDFAQAIELLSGAIATRQKIAICGDYDADGMTSTALLIRALRAMGADVDYAIPSRMTEGYGINRRIVEDFHQEGVQIILTVDNGIAAYDPVARARELGLAVIITDHHDLPPQLPPANAILNPKLIDSASPYRGLAGVGVAYLLARELAEAMGHGQVLADPLLALFTLGTIADLASLTGVNRRWVQQGLALLPHSKIPGVRALIQVSGIEGSQKALKPEAIGFRLGPRINAVGRISTPQTVIELLTTDDEGIALERAMACEQINGSRRQLCELIEAEAIAYIETTKPNLAEERVLVVVRPGWHHGVIGIVASRLVERYGVPVFIGTDEDVDEAALSPTSDLSRVKHLRGSARGIPEFDVFGALQFCGSVLEKFGGHPAAGGFTLAADHLDAFCRRLQLYANLTLHPHHLKPALNIDGQTPLSTLTLELFQQMERLQPCGIGNPEPLFWTPGVRVVEQRPVGRERNHLKLTLEDFSDGSEASVRRTAIAWRWGDYYPLPERLDVAYKLRLNEWQGKRSVELELVGARPAVDDLEIDRVEVQGLVHRAVKPIRFTYGDRPYVCGVFHPEAGPELRLRNGKKEVLVVDGTTGTGLLGACRSEAEAIDVAEPGYFKLVWTALRALERYLKGKSAA
ncbi:MAG: single-stranded-DNA-specific exonuclease RecJ [Elainellaceae cyanobacterium]